MKKTKCVISVEIDINGFCPDMEWIQNHLIEKFLEIRKLSPLYTNEMRISIDGKSVNKK